MAREKPKNKGGRPAFYNTKEEMDILIEEYFNDCDGELLKDVSGDIKLDKSGNPIIIGKRPYTVAGLASALGFRSRQSLLDYQDKPEFMDTIMRAKLKIEVYTNERLFDRDGVQGAKFSLMNNFKGYSDKQEIEQNTTIKSDGFIEALKNETRTLWDSEDEEK